jgi:high-affinity nickel-transport protein
MARILYRRSGNLPDTARTPHTPPMHDLPTDWSTLCALVFLLGLRHGLDADHLAAIDGMTRVASRAGQPHARYCGALFSLGHGAVVVGIALLAGSMGTRWAPPAWFEPVGSLVSIAFLALVGAVNLRAVWRAPAGEAVPLVGVRGRLVDQLVARLPGGRRPVGGPLAAMGVGLLFALSFDTLSQSALFAVLGLQYGGVPQALVLGGLFVAGMLASDGANGWWISHLIHRTDRMAAVASRTMTLAVASVSLLVATMGGARLLSTHFAGWSEGKELYLGSSVIALIALSYLGAAGRAAWRRRTASA